MKKEILKEPYYVDELLKIIRSDISEEKLAECLSDYHENDIAGALEQLDVQERKKIYSILETEKISGIHFFQNIYRIIRIHIGYNFCRIFQL